jgi:hypothetical protein
MTFPNPPVATIRVARITQRDRELGGNGVTLIGNFAPSGRLVTASDGNMASEGYIGHPKQVPQ